VLSYLWSAAQTEFYLPYVVQRLLLNINCFIYVLLALLLILTWILKQWSVSNRSSCSAENLSYLRSYGNEKAINPENRKVRSHNKVR